MNSDATEFPFYLVQLKRWNNYYIFCKISDVGFTLRKDDPSGLKSIIQEIQSKASSQEAAALTDQSRVRFMLDVIMAVRNNNMRKIPNYDPEHLEHLKKLIRNYIRGLYQTKWNIPYST